MPFRFPPLKALKAFESAGRHLNFRLAAEELGVTQGAVAQQVRGLEAALDVKLFERLPRGLALTEEGRKYLSPLQRAFRLIEDATEELRPLQASLTVSVTPSFASKWLVPRLGQFMDANPELDVRVVASQGLANFQSDGVDVAIRQGRPPFGPGLTSDLLFPFEFFPICSPLLQAGEHPIRTPEDIARHVLLHDTHGLWPVFLEKACGGRPMAISRALKFSQTSLAIDAAISGQGVALASEPMVEDDLAAGRLCRPLEITIKSEIGFYAVAPRAPRNAGPVKQMRDWLISQSRSDSLAVNG
ncbi:transcriptional regulator GcvA [Pelagibius sp. Alg239-R121]|uniref:transcriptional regulator GcvA n=1 Tax=Pelagibius sp. Alg239-R121 TaxID=2993448 RepID=UPI0024A6E02F|nr:transcriptional regulator GcvA [Pelagibius sp. Alg239-R121]